VAEALALGTNKSKTTFGERGKEPEQKKQAENRKRKSETKGGRERKGKGRGGA
jgi:hypothetical protein